MSSLNHLENSVPLISYLATGVASLALLSVVCLVLPAFLAFSRPEWNGHPATYESYMKHKIARDNLDQKLAPTGVTSSGMFAMFLVFSILVSLALIVAAFCFWPRHILVGKVLTVASAVLFLPFLCCGALLGIM